MNLKKNDLIIHVNNIDTKIIGFIPESLYYELRDEMSYLIQGAEWTPKYNTFIEKQDKEGNKIKVRAWDGKKHLLRKIKYGLCFYTGLLSVFKKCVEKYNLSIKYVDKREKPENNFILNWDENYKLRDYQQQVIFEAKRFTRGIIKATTGAGKTILTGRIIYELKTAPFLFIVLTKDLLYQAKEEFEKFFMTKDIGIVGDGQLDIKPITIMTIQTVMATLGKKADFLDDDKIDGGTIDISGNKKDKIIELLKSANGVYFDECQHAAAETCEIVLKNLPNAYYRFGGSATPYREDNAEIVIQGLFGRYICDINASFLIENGYLIQPDITFINITKQKYSSNNYQDEYKELIVKNNIRNKIIASYANVFYKNNISTLILVREIEHGKTLEKMIKNSVFVHGNMTTSKRRKNIDDLKSGKLKIMIATSIADEGLDVPRLGALILAGSGKSSTKAFQRVGRVIRKHNEKKNAIVIDFMDGGKYQNKHSYARKRIYKTEPLFKISTNYDFSKFVEEKKDIPLVITSNLW